MEKITRAAFDSGVDAVMLPPPYYFKGIPADGMRNYFREVVRRAVPRDGRVLLYHFPQMHSFGIPFQVIRDLTEEHPDVVVGVKDSQDDLTHSLALRSDFPRFGVFAGSDSLFTGVCSLSLSLSLSLSQNTLQCYIMLFRWPGLLPAALDASQPWPI